MRYGLVQYLLRHQDNLASKVPEISDPFNDKYVIAGSATTEVTRHLSLMRQVPAHQQKQHYSTGDARSTPSTRSASTHGNITTPSASADEWPVVEEDDATRPSRLSASKSAAKWEDIFSEPAQAPSAQITPPIPQRRDSLKDASVRPPLTVEPKSYALAESSKQVPPSQVPASSSEQNASGRPLSVSIKERMKTFELSREPATGNGTATAPSKRVTLPVQDDTTQKKGMYSIEKDV